jgi:hypothetical protein
MAESYVPQGTKVICTNMMSTAPQTVQSTRPYITMHQSKGVPLLTIVDNKLSGSLSCKNPAKFWGGLAMLATGIMMGAAIVLTGGLAAVVVLGAAAVAIGSGVMMGVKVAHDCDATLQVKWEQFHSTVRIQGEFAILNRSVLSCPKGGVVNLIMDPVMAYNAAQQMSSNNGKETAIQLSSQLVMGFISGLTMSAGILPTVTTAILTPLGYWSGEDKLIAKPLMGEEVANKPFVGGTLEAAVGTSAGIVAPSALVMGTSAAAYGAGALVRSPSTQLAGGVGVALGKRMFREDIKFKNIKGGLMGAAANLIIGETTDMWEKSYEDKTIALADQTNRADRNNGINVIATLK